VPVDWVEWFDQMAGEHPRCPEYVGLSVVEVTEQVGSQGLRIIDTNQVETSGGRMFLTADLRANRVNVLVRDGIVTAAARF
jgi:hypothetical protein